MASQQLLELLDPESSWFLNLGSDLSTSSTEVSDNAEKFYKNTVGFLRSKAKLDETAERELPRKFMNDVPSFRMDDSVIMQMPLDSMIDPDQMNLDAVYEVASITLPIFKSIVRNVVKDAGLDPDMCITGLVKNDAELKHLVLAPLKGRGRAMEKIRADYGGQAAKILDIVRCSIIVDTEEELFKIASSLDNGKVVSDSNDFREFKITRCKNRFKDPLFNGYRDALYTIRIPINTSTDIPSSFSSSNNKYHPIVYHSCEIQLHLKDIIYHKSTSHVFYEYFRSYFSGNVSAADARMIVLERVVGEEPLPTLAETIESSLIAGNNILQLEALLDLLGEDNMTEYLLATKVVYRLAELSLHHLESGKVSQDDIERSIHLIVKLGRILRLAYMYSQAEIVFSKIREISLLILGREHRTTLRACHNHALLMAETKRYNDSITLHRETLEIREHTFGDDDPDTLSSAQCLAIVLDKPGHYEEARPYFTRAYEGRAKVLGLDHRDTLDSANGLAVLDMMNGKYDSAESIFRATIKVQKEKYGLDHAKTKWTANNLSGLLMICGRDEEAQEFVREIESGS